MKATLIVTATTALLLTACAGVQTSQTGAPGATASSASGTMYCWKRSLEESDSTLLCNWEASSRDACRSTAQVRLAKSSVAGVPRDAGRCDNGEWLVAVNAK